MLISSIALHATVTGNEVAHRIGRQRVIIGVIVMSAAFGAIWLPVLLGPSPVP